MNHAQILVGIMLLTVVLISGCTQQTAPRSYINDAYGFSFNPPVEWFQVENELPTVAVWFSPQNFSNVSLTIGIPFSLGEGRALNTFADEIEQNLSESAVNHTVLSRDWVPLAKQAYEIVYLYEQDGVMWYVKQVAVQRTRTVFLITFQAPSSLAGSFLPMVDESIRSFV